MKKIEKLTPEQEVQMIEFREEWRGIGLSCERVDKKNTIKGITVLYKKLGKDKPIFIFCPSLMFCQYQITFCKTIFKNDNLWDNLRANLKANLRDNLGANLGANLEANLGDNLWANLKANLEANLRDNLGSNLRDNLWDNLWANLRDNLKYEYTYTIGSMDAYWVAFYEFPEKYLKVKYNKKDSELLQIWVLIVKSCSWFWCYEKFCFVSDRPEKLSFNNDYKLHCEDGPAVRFIDGWEIYYWNGVEVPKKWILEKKEITKEDIKKETNAEKRRCLREILGAKKYYNLLSEGELTIVDEDTDNQGNTMILYQTHDSVIGKVLQFLEVTDPSTGRIYNIYPPSQNSINVWDAKADTFKKEKIKYRHGDVGLLELNKTFSQPIKET